MSRQCYIYIFVFLFYVQLPSSVHGQSPSRFAEIDRMVLAVPDSQSKSIGHLAKYFTKNTNTEIEKVRAVYKWITSNIAYDWEAFSKKAITDQSAENTLKTRMAVCEGYANLFKSLCEASQIQCEVVSGYAKGTDYQIGIPIDEPNHSWNAVKIFGKWQLADPTWGANDKNNRTNDYYFLPPPEKLIFTHFPERATWQLLPHRISMYEFERKQLVYPTFFDLNLQSFNHLESLIETPLSTLYFTFSVPAQTQIEATLHLGEEVIDLQDFISRKYNWVSIKVDSLKAEKIYELNIYGAASDSSQNLDLLITYYISTGKGKLKYQCTPKSDFRVDSITGMPYWFMAKYIENAKKGRYVALEKLLNEGLSLYPTNSWLYFRLGDVYERLTIIDKAITAYQKAIDFAPDYYEPHYNLGVLYYNRAIDIYDSWRKMNPEETKSKEVKKELVTLLSKAKPHVVKALELHPDTTHLEKALKNINHFVN